MLERTESSVLVSLRELGRLEEDRIAREEAARQRKMVEAERAAKDAVEAARREAEARAAADAAREQAARERERFEETRLTAIRDAAIEQAKVAAAAEAELAALRARQAHEVRLAELANAGSLKKWKFVQVGFAAAVVALVAFSGWFVHRERAHAEAQRIALEKEHDARIDGIAVAQNALTRQQRDIDRLIQEKKDRDARAAQDAQAASDKGAAPAPVPTKPRSPGGATRTRAHVGCDPLDPLCGDLPR